MHAVVERKPLRRLYEQYALDRAFAALSRRTRFVPGCGAEWFPRVVFVGEAPGANEERQGQPFVGDSGQLLNAMLSQIGLARDEVWITNAVKYRPPGNATPGESLIRAAMPYLEREISILVPDVVVPLGRVAFLTLKRSGSIMAARGKPVMPVRIDIRTGRPAIRNAPPILPLLHPAAVLRGLQSRADYAKDFECLRLLLD